MINFYVTEPHYKHFLIMAYRVLQYTSSVTFPVAGQTDSTFFMFCEYRLKSFTHNFINKKLDLS